LDAVAYFRPVVASCSLGRVSQRLSVKEAARMLGISADAVRKRVSRGTLEAEKSPDGTLTVLVDAGADGNRDSGLQTTIAHLETLERYVTETLERYVTRLEGENEYLREETRRKDHIIAGLVERIPALEAPSEPSRSPR
jgi:excisionase family DNA binding protein